MTRFLVALLLLCAQGAWADTDYVCLKECKRTLGGTASCMPKCSYDKDSVPLTGNKQQFRCFTQCMADGVASPICLPQCSAGYVPKKKPAEDYNPNPLENFTTSDEILLERKLHTPQPNIDSRCMRACTKGGLQYQLCAQNCVK